MRRGTATIACSLAATASMTGCSARAGSAVLASRPAASHTPAAELRIDSVGFLPTETKYAYLMTSHAVKHESFTVQDAGGHSVLTGQAETTSRGRWSSTYPDVYSVDISPLTAPGRYTVHVSGAVTATSQPFRVESPAALDGSIVNAGVSFFGAQRDGADQLPGGLDRKPSHTNDAHAGVYQLPHFVHPNRSDRIKGGLHRVPRKSVIDAEGGWFDAGDFLKFTHTTAYADVLLSASVRALGSSAPAALRAEAAYGEAWLAKMWNQKTRTLYLQVGVGGGNTANTFYGDHDLWRLPQADDHDAKQRDRFAAAHRPVFRAAAPGHRISPNLAGRVSAAFALAAQNDAVSDAAKARRELHAAVTVFNLAATTHPPRPLVTAAPFEYYPEDSWHDDMALGAAEIARAEVDLGHSPAPYLIVAAQSIKAYVRHDSGGDTFNLYDTSALAESDYYGLPFHHSRAAGISKAAVLADLRQQINRARKRSAHDPFRAGGYYNEFDVDSHTFGLIATVAMYDAATGTSAYTAFATAQRDWLFGANAWGASFVVGEGTHYPHCMQHQVANLAGSLDGSAPVDVGAVVNGPNDARIFHGGLGSLQDGVRRCPANRVDAYQPFNGHGSRYLDDTRSWQTSEPAIDMTGTAILAGALEQALP